MDNNNALINDQEALSKQVYEKNFTEIKGILNAINVGTNKAYDAKEVDSFLTAVGTELERYESNMGKLYGFYSKYRGNLHNIKPVSQDQSFVTGELEDVKIDDRNAHFAEKEAAKSIDKVQQHMSELLIRAEERAESVVLEAELEKKEILENAREQARQFLEETQLRTTELQNKASEDMQKAEQARQTLEDKAKEVKSDIVRKSQEMKDLSDTLFEMSGKLKVIAESENIVDKEA